jgi:hypothetical protein
VWRESRASNVGPVGAGLAPPGVNLVAILTAKGASNRRPGSFSLANYLVSRNEQQCRKRKPRLIMFFFSIGNPPKEPLFKLTHYPSSVCLDFRFLFAIVAA